MSAKRSRRQSPLVPAPAAAPEAPRRAAALDDVAHDASAAVTPEAGRPGSSTDELPDVALSSKRKRIDGARLPCNRAQHPLAVM
eukprot:3661454-Prymnesium_polylepis.1